MQSGIGIWLVILLLFVQPLFAQQAGEPPPYKQVRYEEDYRYLLADTTERDVWDPLKFIALTQSKRNYLSLGGEVRFHYERFRNRDWGIHPQPHDGYLLQRYMMHADLHLGEKLRFFGQLKSGLVAGQAGEPDLPDKDALDLHQAFADVNIPLSGSLHATIRAGRQELTYGSSRFVSVREGPNVRLAFDALKLILQKEEYQLDAFYSRPVTTETGIFDDRADPNERFWGLYSTHPLPSLFKGYADLYYFGLERREAEFDQGTAHEQRHIGGLRLWNNDTDLYYDIEAQYQLGNFGSGNIRAWALASHFTYTLAQVPLQPEAGIRTGIRSGNRNPADPNLQTFNPLYPRGSIFQQIAQVGPTNLYDVHPNLRLTLWKGFKADFVADFFWRYSLQDGVYAVPYNLLIASGNSRARHIGNQYSVEAEWQVNRQLSFEFFLTYFTAGRFIREAVGGQAITFIAPRVSYRF